MQPIITKALVTRTVAEMRENYQENYDGRVADAKDS